MTFGSTSACCLLPPRAAIVFEGYLFLQLAFCSSTSPSSSSWPAHFLLPEIIIYEFALLSPVFESDLNPRPGPNRIASDRIVRLSSAICAFLLSA